MMPKPQYIVAKKNAIGSAWAHVLGVAWLLPSSGDLSPLSFFLHHWFILVVALAGGAGLSASTLYLVRWLISRHKGDGDLAIAKVQRENNYSIIVGRSMKVVQDQTTGDIVILKRGGEPLAKLSVLESRALAAYIASVTKYKHCAHYNCLEPEVPGVGYCRYHREDILTEGVAIKPVFLPEDTGWMPRTEEQQLEVQGLRTEARDAEIEDLEQRLRVANGD